MINAQSRELIACGCIIGFQVWAPCLSYPGSALTVWDFMSRGDDLEAAIELFSVEYGIADFRSQPTGAAFAWKHSIRGDEVMTFRTSTFAAHLSAKPEINSDFIVGWNSAGRSLIGAGRTALHVGTGTPVLHTRDQPTAVQHFDVVQNLVHIDHRFVESVAGQFTDHFAGFLSFPGGLARSSAAGKAWCSAVNRVGRIWLPSQSEMSDVLRLELARTMAVAMLSAFPYAVGTTPVAVGSLGPRTVVAAVEFAYANSHLPICGADLAAAAGVSPRALQLAFRRHLSTTPDGLIRSIRLRHVREELLQHSPYSLAVSDVARRWGFLHLGRFSASYFSEFNELPSCTLRNSATARPAHHYQTS